jgi:hypothetical protein
MSGMNYEVILIQGSTLVEKACFATFYEARKCYRENEIHYDCVSITPMNEAALQKLADMGWL